MVGKMPNVTWLEGSYVETIKGWQSGWFYIVEPRDSNWVAAPKFRSGAPTRLTSWKEKDMSWGSAVELTRLQTCIQNMTNKKIKLINMVQVMLFHRILPCQRRAFDLWEFDSAKNHTLRELYDTMHEDFWRVLFKSAEIPPSLTEDRRLNAKRRANPVGFYISQGIYSPWFSYVLDLSFHVINRTG